MNDTNQFYDAEIKKRDAEIAKLKAALEVYAKQLGWSPAIDIQWVMEDKGMTAVNALKAIGAI